MTLLTPGSETLTHPLTEFEPPVSAEQSDGDNGRGKGKTLVLSAVFGVAGTLHQAAEPGAENTVTWDDRYADQESESLRTCPVDPTVISFFQYICQEDKVDVFWLDGYREESINRFRMASGLISGPLVERSVAEQYPLTSQGVQAHWLSSAGAHLAVTGGYRRVVWIHPIRRITAEYWIEAYVQAYAPGLNAPPIHQFNPHPFLSSAEIAQIMPLLTD